MTIETIILTVGVALYLVLAGVLSAGRAQQVHGYAHWLMLALAIWVAGGWLLVNATSPDLIDIALTVNYTGSVLVPETGVMVVAHVSARALPLLVSSLLWLVPIVSLVIMIVPTLRPMMWSGPIDYLALAHAFELQRGWWLNWVHLPYAVAVYCLAVAGLARHARRQSRRLRIELLALAAVALAPLAVGVLRALGIAPWHTVSAATVIAALTPAVAWLVLRHGALFNDSIGHQALFDQMSDAVVLVDDHHHMISVNPAAAELFDLDGRHVRGLPLQQTVPTLAALMGDPSTDANHEAFTLNGRRLALRVSHVRRPGDAQVLRLLICQDITETYRAAATVRRNEALFRTLIHHASNAILRLSLVNDQSEYPDFEITVANPQGARLFESSPDALIGKTLGRQLFGTAVSDRQYALQKIVPVIREAQATGRRQDIEFCLSENGAKRWYRLLADPVDKDIGLTFIDISSERRQQDALHSQAMSDALTGVLNRRGFESAAGNYLHNASETLDAALLFVDLNGFKAVNDSFGHEAGDNILREVAVRMRETLRLQDIVARIGGDEFVALVTDTSRDDAVALRDRISRHLSHTYRLQDGRSVNCSASVGMSIYPQSATSLELLIKQADDDMYQVKAGHHKDRLRVDARMRLVE